MSKTIINDTSSVALMLNKDSLKEKVKEEYVSYAKKYIKKTNNGSSKLKQNINIENSINSEKVSDFGKDEIMNNNVKVGRYSERSVKKIKEVKGVAKRSISKIEKFKNISDKKSSNENNKEENPLKEKQSKLRKVTIAKKFASSKDTIGVVEAAVLNVVSHFLKGTTITIALTTIAILLPIIAIIAVVLGMGLLIMGTSYTCEDLDLNKAYTYITELVTDEQVAINKELNKSGYNGIYLYKNGSRVSSVTVNVDVYDMLAYLSIKYDDYKFSKIKKDIKEIVQDLIHHETEVIKRTSTDSEGKKHTKRYLYIYYYETEFEKYLEDNDLFNDDEKERYQAFKDQSGTYSRQDLINPFTETEWQTIVSSPFGYRVDPIDSTKAYHNGIDLAMPEGTPVKAVMSGTITRSYDEDGFGNYIIIKSGEKKTLYGHLSSFERSIPNGTIVQKGTVIGYVGTSGRSTGAHLHLGYELGGEWVNPAFYIIE